MNGHVFEHFCTRNGMTEDNTALGYQTWPPRYLINTTIHSLLLKCWCVLLIAVGRSKCCIHLHCFLQCMLTLNFYHHVWCLNHPEYTFIGRGFPTAPMIIIIRMLHGHSQSPAGSADSLALHVYMVQCDIRFNTKYYYCNQWEQIAVYLLFSTVEGEAIREVPTMQQW